MSVTSFTVDLNILRRNDVYRARAHLIRRSDARTGDDDLFQSRVGRCRRSGCLLRQAGMLVTAISGRKEQALSQGVYTLKHIKYLPSRVQNSTEGLAASIAPSCLRNMTSHASSYCYLPKIENRLAPCDRQIVRRFVRGEKFTPLAFVQQKPQRSLGSRSTRFD